MSVPAVSVVIPARDAAGTLGAALDGLAAQRGADFEVFVVDDGSTDGTAALAEAHPSGPTVLRRAAHGAGAARNAGAAVARAPVLAFTDADCVPEPGWLAAGLAALARADLVQGRVVPERPPGARERTIAVERETGLYETANLLVTRAAYDLAGGFGDGLAATGRPFGEDVAFAWRARRAGSRTAFASDAVVRHAVFPTTTRDRLEERLRLRHFPALVKEVPELRAHALHRRVFLSPRTARLDLALAGVLAVAASRRPWPLLAALPYLRRSRRPSTVALDLVGALSLLVGSLRARRPVL